MNQTVSIKLADMSLDELVMLSQGLGREVDKLREQRAYVNSKIAARLAAGERNGQSASAGVDIPVGDAVAPGAVIEASAKV